MITTASGAFSVPLEAGDYTVSLPLITWRTPFKISVPDSTSTINITNLMFSPVTYTYTNYFPMAPIHVNAASVNVLSTAGTVTLLDSGASIPAGALAARNVIVIEAFGSVADPGNNGPSVTFTLKLGSTTICTRSATGGNANWHLRALITLRSVGSSGSVAASMAVMQDNLSLAVLPFNTTTTTVNTTTSLAVDLTAAIDDFTGSEAVTCNQLLIRIL
jgi:hypothetical protein